MIYIHSDALKELYREMAMTTDMLEQLQQIDRATLTNFVRQDQHSPSFEISNWSVQPMTHEKVIDITGGLYCYSGDGHDERGIRPWSIALKILNQPDGWCLDPREWCYWKRELLAFKSGTLAGLPAVRVPRCYQVTEHDRSGWIWMEHIVESAPRTWTLENYQRAALHMGRMGGTFASGMPVPDHPWLTSFFRSNQQDGSFAVAFMNPESPQNVWQEPVVQSAYSESLKLKVSGIWTDRHQFFDVLDRLPQVFCHNDLHRRNLMFRTGTDHQEELVGLDWAFCGPGALGADMGELVGSSLYFFEFDPAQAEELERVVLTGYLEGIQQTGWSGDPRLARLGYLISSALWMGATLPYWLHFNLGQESTVNLQAQFGYPAEVLRDGWVGLNEFLVSRADEARHLIKVLNLA